MLNLPNTLTLLRLVAIPIFLICVTSGWYGAALSIFMAAGITDALDGALARLTDTFTEFGATLDPVADKLLILSSFVVLTWYGVVAPWLLIVVVSRDLVLLIGYVAIQFVSEPITVRPTAVGKTATFFQIFSVGFALLALARPDLPLALLNLCTQSVAALATAISGFQYVYRGLLWQQTHPAPPAAK